MTNPVGSFSDMLRRALGPRINADATSFPEMFAANGVMEFPFAYPGLPKRLEGREALVEHLTKLGSLIAFDRMGEAKAHAMADPDMVVLEFEAFGRGLPSGEPYEQSYVSLIRTRNGSIVHYTDYWNPLALLRATRGAAAVADLVGGETPHA